MSVAVCNCNMVEKVYSPLNCKSKYLKRQLMHHLMSKNFKQLYFKSSQPIFKTKIVVCFHLKRITSHKKDRQKENFGLQNLVEL